MGCSLWGHKELDMAERVPLSLSHLPGVNVTGCSHLGQNGDQGNDLTLARTSNKETRNNEDFSQDYCTNQETPIRTAEQRTRYLIRWLWLGSQQ